MPAGQTGIELLDGIAYNLHQQLVGIAAALVDLQSAMSATQALHGQSHGGIAVVGFHLLIFEGSGDVDATGRANHKLTPCLRVEVHEDVALQLAFWQVVGTIHARLFVGRDECVDGSMLQGLVLHDGHDGSHAQSVVGAQGGALSLHPLTVDPRLYGVGLEVVCRLGCLLWHHVHVGLQDDALFVLIA